MSLTQAFGVISDILNIVGVAILAIGGIGSAIWFAIAQIRRALGGKVYELNNVRKFIVERTILSLDFFVGADIVRTVAKLTFQDLGLLAGIVAIRIILAYFLERELGKKLPE